MRKLRQAFAAGSGLSEFSARMRHIFVVNLLWVLCSLPVVTYGAASAAAQDTLQYTDRAEKLKTAKLFFSALRRHFRRASILWLELACIGAVLGGGIYLLARSGSRNAALLSIAFFFLFLYGIILAYAFYVLVRSDGSPAEVLVFSLMGGLRQLPRSVPVVLLAAVPAVMFVFFTEWFLYTGLLWLVYGFAFIAYVSQLIMRSALAKLARDTDFVLPAPEEIPAEAASGI